MCQQKAEKHIPTYTQGICNMSLVRIRLPQNQAMWATDNYINYTYAQPLQ